MILVLNSRAKQLQITTDWLIDWVKVLCPTWHKICHVGDILHSQSLGIVLKKLNLTQWKQTTTTTTTTIVLRPFVRDYPGEPVPEETFTHPPSWSSPNLYQLLPSTTIYSILLVQIACLAIFFEQPLSTSFLVYLLVWSPPPHIPYISSPNQCLLFTTHAHTITTCFAVVSILCYLFLVFLSTPYLELSLSP